MLHGYRSEIIEGTVNPEDVIKLKHELRKRKVPERAIDGLEGKLHTCRDRVGYKHQNQWYIKVIIGDKPSKWWRSVKSFARDADTWSVPYCQGFNTEHALAAAVKACCDTADSPCHALQGSDCLR